MTEPVTCAHGQPIVGDCATCDAEVYCDTCEGCHLPEECPLR